MKTKHLTYRQSIRKQFCLRPLGPISLAVVCLFVAVGIYAPLLASSKPLFVRFEGSSYFPLFRYLFYPGFFSKKLDVFYNLLMFFFPLLVIFGLSFKNRRIGRFLFAGTVACLCGIFLYLAIYPPGDPGFSPQLNEYRQALLKRHVEEKTPVVPDWNREVDLMTPYARLNLLLRYRQYKRLHDRLSVHEKAYREYMEKIGSSEIVFPTLWNLTYAKESMSDATPETRYSRDRRNWLEEHADEVKYEIMPPVRPFHWEDDAGGDGTLNRLVGWQDLTRINRKDLVSALIFGIRISLSVGFLAIAVALCIGIPIGAYSGYYGGKIDLLTYRLIEVWESMPTFFMLLTVVAFFRSKSIFLVITVIGLFGWTGFSRFIRGEFLRQKQLAYVEACRAIGYPDRRIIFSHLLPNAIPPLLTLIPFAVTAAITSEAGLSFLGLGEEGSNSWGVLMDEGRSAFPGESYLLWPPAILLTILLVSIALTGDSLRDALDPKLHKA